MSRHLGRWLCLFLLLSAAPLTAAEQTFTGTVAEVTGDVVLVRTTAPVSPVAGDAIQIFGKVPGLDAEVLIGRGKVTELRDGLIAARIDARGMLTPGQTARITSSQATGGKALPPSPPAAGFVELFNGSDLTGWQTPPESVVTWKVVDGVLRSDAGVRGWLFWQREYADFELQAEYRLSQGANGGIVIRAPSPDASFGPDDSSHQGLEIQLIDDISLPDDAPANQHSGAIWGVVGPAAIQERPPEQWNGLRVTVRGRRVAIALNGTPTVDVELDQYSELADQFPGLRRAAGYLGLQAYAGRVEFRKLSLRPLGMLDGATGSSVTTFPALPNVLEIRGRVSEVLAGDATMQIEGAKLPNVGDHVDLDRPLNTPDFKVRRVGRGKVREVLGGEIFVALDAESGSVTPGDQARIAVGNSPTSAPPLPAAPPPVRLSPSFSPASVPPSLPGSLPYTPTRLDWLAVELNAFARIQTLATERFTLMFTPRPTDDTIVIYVRYLPSANQNDLRGAIREARNIISIITKRHGWDGWVNVVEDVAAM